jgi:DNA-directed RNA polymerase specialized sigma54-like protein
MALEGISTLLDVESRQRRLGRPDTTKEIRDLIRKMCAANATWGAPRIHGELHKLGVDVSQATVAKYMIHRTKPPSQTWRTFLENHIKTMVSVDFFVVAAPEPAWLSRIRRLQPERRLS